MFLLKNVENISIIYFYVPLVSSHNTHINFSYVFFSDISCKYNRIMQCDCT